MKPNRIRELAMSQHWQNLYNTSKEIGTFKLFDNASELTEVQDSFLYWLSIYSDLYTDLAMGEKFISKEVIADHIRAEAYLIYKRHKRKEDKKSMDKQAEPKTGKVSHPTIPKIVFTGKGCD